MVGGTQEDRGNLEVDGCSTDHPVDQLIAHRLVAQALFHQLVVVHRKTLEHLLSSRLGLGLHRLGNRFDSQHFAVLAIEVHRLHRDQVDNAFEIFTQTDRQLHQHRFHAQLGADLRTHLDRIGSGAVQLVDEDQSRHAVSLDLTIDGQRLRLHATDSAQDQHRSVQHPQAPLHLNREIDVAGSIDQVDAVIGPVDSCRRTGDRDPAFLLEIHVIHRGTTPTMNLLHPVQSTGVEQDPLAERGLARIDVGRNANVSQQVETHRITLVSGFGRLVPG